MRLVVESYKSRQLSMSEWRQLQVFHRDAYMQEQDCTQQEADYRILIDNPVRYYQNHLSPNVSNTDTKQAFSHPRVTIAKSNNELVGFAYGANKAWGFNSLVRTMKRASVRGNSFALIDMVAKPEMGISPLEIARQTGKILLEGARAHQPVTTDIYPELNELKELFITGLGFKKTEETGELIYGPDTQPYLCVSMRAPSVNKVLQRLCLMPRVV